VQRTLGIAIPTYNRVTQTLVAFLDVHDDPRVSCVAISDDGSDLPTYKSLVEQTMLSKVTIAHHSQNVGSWANKRMVVELCHAEWVALIDSDNVVRGDYLDALWKQEWDKNTLYLPMRGVPALDYTEYAGAFINRENIASCISTPLIQMALNTGNFFVHRASHLQVSEGAAEESYASDGIYFVYRWLASGRRVLITPNLSYTHLVHDGHWMRTAQQSTAFANELIRRMRNNVWEVPCAV